MKRVLTALLLIPPVVYTIFSGPLWLFSAVVTLVALLCFYEYHRLAAHHNADFPVVLGYAVGLGVLFVPEGSWEFLTLLAVLALLVSLRQQDLAHYLPAAGALTLGVLYIFGAWRCGIRLRAASPYWLFFALSINWVGDVVAFYVGRAVGRRKLAPRVSPAKSWEGSIGSLAATMIVGTFFLSSLFRLPLLEAAGISVLANVAGQMGDLGESALKRGAGVKDSGAMLPGHGGWLDRLDSSLFSLPVTYAAAHFFGRL